MYVYVFSVRKTYLRNRMLITPYLNGILDLYITLGVGSLICIWLISDGQFGLHELLVTVFQIEHRKRKQIPAGPTYRAFKQMQRACHAKQLAFPRRTVLYIFGRSLYFNIIRFFK